MMIHNALTNRRSIVCHRSDNWARHIGWTNNYVICYALSMHTAAIACHLHAGVLVPPHFS